MRIVQILESGDGTLLGLGEDGAVYEQYHNHWSLLLPALDSPSFVGSFEGEDVFLHGPGGKAKRLGELLAKASEPECPCLDWDSVGTDPHTGHKLKRCNDCGKISVR